MNGHKLHDEGLAQKIRDDCLGKPVFQRAFDVVDWHGTDILFRLKDAKFKKAAEDEIKEPLKKWHFKVAVAMAETMKYIEKPSSAIYSAIFGLLKEKGKRLDKTVIDSVRPRDAV